MLWTSNRVLKPVCLPSKMAAGIPDSFVPSNQSPVTSGHIVTNVVVHHYVLDLIAIIGT